MNDIRDFGGHGGGVDFLDTVADDVSDEGLAEAAQQAAEGGVGRIPFSGERKQGCAFSRVADEFGSGM